MIFCRFRFDLLISCNIRCRLRCSVRRDLRRLRLGSGLEFVVVGVGYIGLVVGVVVGVG